MAIVTAAQVREHFPQIVGTAEDTLLDTMIARADALSAAYCGFPVGDSGSRTLASQTYTIYVDEPRPSESLCIDLGIRPVISITNAYIDSGWDYTADEVPAADMVLDKARGWVWLRPDASVSWDESPRANKIVVVAGFATTPPDLVAAACMLVRHLLDLRAVAGKSSISVNGVGYSTRVDHDDLIPASVRAALAPYVLGGSRGG